MSSKRIRFTIPSPEDALALAEGARFESEMDAEGYLLLRIRMASAEAQGDPPKPMNFNGFEAVVVLNHFTASYICSALFVADPEAAQELIETLKQCNMLPDDFSISRLPTNTPTEH